MPYPLFVLGLQGAALQRMQQLQAAQLAGGQVDADDLTGLWIDLFETANG